LLPPPTSHSAVDVNFEFQVRCIGCALALIMSLVYSHLSFHDLNFSRSLRQAPRLTTSKSRFRCVAITTKAPPAPFCMAKTNIYFYHSCFAA
jgi:hypothetical protein